MYDVLIVGIITVSYVGITYMNTNRDIKKEKLEVEKKELEVEKEELEIEKKRVRT